MPWNVSPDEIRARHPKGIILSGGPRSTVGPDAPDIDRSIVSGAVPVLGTCYGMQLLANMLGGSVERGRLG